MIKKTMHEAFLSQLANPFFTFNEARSWYAAQKGGRMAYTANVYEVVINPLIAKGKARRSVHHKGLYLLAGVEEEAKASEQINPSSQQGGSEQTGELDEFAKYLRRKGVVE